MRRLAKPADLTAAEFKAALEAEGFKHIRHTDGFVDLQRPQSVRFQRRAAIRAVNGRIQRRETLAMLRRIRAEERAEADRLAEAKAKTERLIATLAPSALVPPRAGMAPTAAVRRMAEDMREGASHGGVTETDLIRRGYTPSQIKLHGEDARALAQQLAGASL